MKIFRLMRYAHPRDNACQWCMTPLVWAAEIDEDGYRKVYNLPCGHSHFGLLPADKLALAILMVESQ